MTRATERLEVGQRIFPPGAEMATLQTCIKAGLRYRQALAERDQAIIDAIEAGESLRTVAKAVGLTHTAVAKIVHRISNAD